MTQPMSADRQKLKLMVAVVDRGKGDVVARLLREAGSYICMVAMGTGTAKSDIMDYLGLNDSRKDVVISSIRASDSARILNRLCREMNMDKPGHGIAFTIPMSSVAGQQSYSLLRGCAEKGK